MTRRGWRTALGPGRHPVSSCYFWYFHSPCGGAAEYDFDSDVVDERWVPGVFEQTPEVFAEWCLAEGMADSLLVQGHPNRRHDQAQELTRAERNGLITTMSKKPEEFEDVPSTTTSPARGSSTPSARARATISNAFFYSLMKAENRAEFLADERKYLQKFPMTEAQRDAVVKRDWNTLLELGGVSYAIVKLAFTDKKSYQHMASKMAGVTESEYVKMMLAGGRSPDGWRSKSERKG